MTATIRSGTIADIGATLALWNAAEALPSATDSEQDLERLLNRDPEALLLALSGEEVIGTLIVAWDGWRGSFYRLAVHPAWRRQGIATALWEAVGYQRQAEQSRFVRMLAR